MIDPDNRIHCSEIVIRLLTKKRHLEDGGASAEAFLLRDKNENREDGLSVFRILVISPEECERKLTTIFGQATLHVGHVRAISSTVEFSIDVVKDEEHGGLGHASITGLPKPSKDLLMAERVARLLRDQSRRLR